MKPLSCIVQVTDLSFPFSVPSLFFSHVLCSSYLQSCSAAHHRRRGELGGERYSLVSNCVVFMHELLHIAHYGSVRVYTWLLGNDDN